MSESVVAHNGKPDKRRWRRIAIEILVVLLILGAVRFYQMRDVTSGPAPDLAGESLDGRSVSLSAMAGQPVLVHFWATWCPVCRLEEDSIHAIAEDYPVITVSLDTASPDEVQVYLDKQGLQFPVLHDPDGSIGSQYGVPGVPASFVVDGAGQIRFTEVGYTTGWGLRLRLWLAGILYGPSSS